MKLIFGDLDGKAIAANKHKETALFEKRVTNATSVMTNFLTFPEVWAGIAAWPQQVQHIPLPVLREAARRILAARKAIHE